MYELDDHRPQTAGRSASPRWPWLLLGLVLVFSFAIVASMACGYFARSRHNLLSFCAFPAALLAGFGTAWAFRRARLRNRFAIAILSILVGASGLLGYWYGVYRDRAAWAETQPDPGNGEIRIRIVPKNGPSTDSVERPLPASFVEFLRRLSEDGYDWKSRFRIERTTGPFNTVLYYQWWGYIALVVGFVLWIARPMAKAIITPARGSTSRR